MKHLNTLCQTTLLFFIHTLATAYYMCAFFFLLLLKRQPVGGLYIWNNRKERNPMYKEPKWKRHIGRDEKMIVLFTYFTCSYFNSSSCLFYIMFIRLSFYSILEKYFSSLGVVYEWRPIFKWVWCTICFNVFLRFTFYDIFKFSFLKQMKILWHID